MCRKVSKHVDSKLADLPPQRLRVELKRLEEVLGDFLRRLENDNNCGDDSDSDMNREENKKNLDDMPAGENIAQDKLDCERAIPFE